MTINQETKDYIRRHADGDVRRLALAKKPGDGIDMPFALDQIAGRQTAKAKLPSWHGIADIIFPPHISMEQCSSEQTANYKVEALQRALRNVFSDEEDLKNCHFIDLTGGFGVDFSFLAKRFSSATYVERQQHLCDIARHNLPLLGLQSAEILCSDSREAVENIGSIAHGKSVAVFMDPARRDTNGQRTYAITDCTPDVTALLPTLLQPSAVVMLKLSPMLDIHGTVKALNDAAASKDAVREVHVVATANECKELLVILSEKYHSIVSCHCVNDRQTFVTDALSDTVPPPVPPQGIDIAPMPSLTSALYLHVPNAAIMKAGIFSQIETAFSIPQVSPNSHLFLSHAPIEGFPGRTFKVLSLTTMNKKELRKALQSVGSANISVRNFPLSTDALRRKLKLKDGGDTYIFATTTSANDHLLFFCKKA